jgi:hypothetical protein
MNMRERAEITNAVIPEIKTELVNAGMIVDEAHVHIDRQNPHSPISYIRIFGEYKISKSQPSKLLAEYGGTNGSISMWDDNDEPAYRNYTIMIMLNQY